MQRALFSQVPAVAGTHERRCILGEIAKRGRGPFERSEAHLKGEVGPLWQRGYHDHIIRCERDRERIFAYIKDNPRKWAEDRFYSEDGCRMIVGAGNWPHPRGLELSFRR